MTEGDFKKMVLGDVFGLVVKLLVEMPSPVSAGFGTWLRLGPQRPASANLVSSGNGSSPRHPYRKRRWGSWLHASTDGSAPVKLSGGEGK